MYSCEDCGTAYDTLASFRQHRETVHGNGKIFDCPVCFKKCTSSSQLEVHLRSHTGERPFKCGECEKSFRRQSHLTVHIQRHSGQATFKCDQCEKSFPQQSELKQHTKIHTGHKPYQCGLCGKCFAREDYVRVHMRTHSVGVGISGVAQGMQGDTVLRAQGTKHVYVMGPDVRETGESIILQEAQGDWDQ